MPAWPTEQFIVPLLAEHIERALSLHCRPRAPGAAVLDVGCGGQPLRPRLEALGYRYFSSDPRPIPNLPVDFDWRLDEPELPRELQDHDGFGLIVCTEVLEHVADWSAAWRNIAVLLGPAGRLLVTCPAFYVLHEEPWDYWRPTDHALEHFSGLHALVVIHRARLGDGFDVLGTLLAGTGVKARTPRCSARLKARLLDELRRRVLRSLAVRGSLRSDLAAPSGVYLSNLMVLEKPGP